MGDLTTTQAFFLGLMVAWSPTVLWLTWTLLLGDIPKMNDGRE